MAQIAQLRAELAGNHDDDTRPSEPELIPPPAKRIASH